MGLQIGATLNLVDYQVDDQGVHTHFVSPNPGPGEPSDYFLLLTFNDLQGALTQDALINLVQTRLGRNARAVGVGVKLDGLIGHSWTV